MAEIKFRPTVQSLSEDFFQFHQLEMGPVLGSGMTGQVFLATHYSNQNKPPVRLACKKFSLLTDDGGVRNKTLFASEVTLLQQITHPHVVRHVLSARCPDYLVICTSLCSGGTLSSKLSNMTSDMCGLYLTQLACAVRYLNHKMRIIHFDIKPKNVFINFKGDAILGDFGLSERVRPEVKTLVNHGVPGTFGFVALELRKSGEFDPFKVDVYSLGVVLWCMAFMREPTRQTAYAYLHMVRLHQGIPQTFRWCLESMLESDPTIRPDIVQVLDKLRADNFRAAVRRLSHAHHFAYDMRFELLASEFTRSYQYHFKPAQVTLSTSVDVTDSYSLIQ